MKQDRETLASLERRLHEIAHGIPQSKQPDRDKLIELSGWDWFVIITVMAVIVCIVALAVVVISIVLGEVAAHSQTLFKD